MTDTARENGENRATVRMPTVERRTAGATATTGSKVPGGSSTKRSCQSTKPAARSTATTSATPARSEEHTSELQSLMRISYAVFCLKKKTRTQQDKKR